MYAIKMFALAQKIWNDTNFSANDIGETNFEFLGHDLFLENFVAQWAHIRTGENPRFEI